MMPLPNQFQSNIKSLEFLSLLHDIKPAIRILCSQYNATQFGLFLNSKKLFYSFSDFKLIKQTTNSFYSDTSIKVDLNDSRDGHYVFYISKNINTEAIKDLEQKSKHKDLGIALGYPECCCDFFVKHFSPTTTDLTLNILNNSHGSHFQFYTNIAARHFDINLLSYFPCSFHCNKSIEIGKQNLNLLKKHDKEKATLFEKTLRSGVLYSNNGIFLLEGYTLENNKLKINNITPSTINKFYYFLTETGNFEILANNKIKIQNETIDNIGFMGFD
tara:strand:- start:1543 stop:2361 length:819 start_codon:yes stop_codon:yes gene_type:complete